MGVVRAVVEDTSPVAGGRLRCPDFNRGGVGVQEIGTELERTRTVAAACQLRLAVGNRDVGADLRRGGTALRIVEVAVEAPAVGEGRGDGIRAASREIEVESVDAAAMDVRQDFTRWTTRVELLPLVAVMVYSPAGSMSAYLPVEEADVVV